MHAQLRFAGAARPALACACQSIKREAYLNNSCLSEDPDAIR